MASTFESRLAEWFIRSMASGKHDDLDLYNLDYTQEKSCLRRLGKTVDIIRAEMSGFSFTFDKQLSSYVSGYKSFAYISTYVLNQNLLGKAIGGCYSRHDMMASQSFMISSIQKKHYTLRDINGKVVSTSCDAIPCLLKYDHRILIPFFVSDLGHELYLVCNEFWGQPCGVIDFVNRIYYSDGSSPKMRSDDPSLSIYNLTLNLLGWRLAHICQSVKSTTPNVNVMLGGTVNLSHILWNYLGGIEVLRRTGSLDGNYNLVQISNLLYPIDHLPKQPLDFSSLTPLSQITALAKSGLSSGLWIRCSDAANSPLLAERLLSADFSGSIYKSIRLTEQRERLEAPNNVDDLASLVKDNYHLLPVYSKSNEVSIAITLRCTNRSLNNQGLILAKTIVLLSGRLSYLHVFLDGSSKGANSIVIAKEKEMADSIESNEDIVALVKAGKLRITSTVQMKLSDQLELYRHINTYLTYVSGGMVKLAAFCKALGTAMCPESHTILHQSYLLRDLDNTFLLNQRLASLLFTPSCRFAMMHDYVGYANLNRPLSLLLGNLINESNDSIDNSRLIKRDNDFDSLFELSAENMCLNTLRCLVYNNILSGKR